MAEAGVPPRLPAMILAAGHGSRLAPLTDHIPKPLLPVDGVPLLDRIIARLDAMEAARIGPIAVNTHHLGRMIADHLDRRADRERFVLFPEPEILGTGGGVRGAAAVLGKSDHFLVHNGDVLCDADLDALWRAHLAGGAMATLLLAPCPRYDSVLLAGDGAVRAIAGEPAVSPETGDRLLTYTGIGIFRAEILADIAPGFGSLVDPLRRALEREGGGVRGLAPAGLGWSDLGTFARYLGAQTDDTAGGRPGVTCHLERITGHGSDRRFWRIAEEDFRAVAMISPPADEEWERFLVCGRFLAAHDLGPAAFLRVDDEERAVVMEDLGRESLWALAKAGRGRPAVLVPRYLDVVDTLLRLQAHTEAAGRECPLAVDRVLDGAALRWETDYFRDRFLVEHAGLPDSRLAGLAEEWQALRSVVVKQPQVLLHRDFQSQNIFCHEGRVRLVDFQGLRLGPLGYDPASLLWDPYVNLPAAVRDRALDQYAAGVRDGVAGGASLEAEEVRAMVLAAALQRLMQALGAFAFLGRHKGKKAFLDHIPRGLEHLRRVLDEVAACAAGPHDRWLPGPLPGPLPVLTGLVQELAARYPLPSGEADGDDDA